jgi:hypothetical protein
MMLLEGISLRLINLDTHSKMSCDICISLSLIPFILNTVN